jgi:hypothetical protein
MEMVTAIGFAAYAGRWSMIRPRIKLPTPDAPPNDVYSMADPEYLPEALREIYGWLYYSEREPSREALVQVMSMAQGYIHLTTYELGQENCVEKLRDIWRARRARETKGEAAE